ncbi:MAG: hypothetical protein LUE12_01990 [Ruminococcus sp.]|nr:hypothetical protein [Ruminococcus sp.]
MIKKRRFGIVMSAAGSAAVAAVIIAAIIILPKSSSGKIEVSEDTELIETTTTEKFSQAISDLIAENDDPLVVSGEQSTNRLLLMFEGNDIDLSDFPAVTVIADEDNFVIIQFSNEEGAKKCLESLKNMDGVIYAKEDEYSQYLDSSDDDITSSASTSTTYIFHIIAGSRIYGAGSAVRMADGTKYSVGNCRSY